VTLARQLGSPPAPTAAASDSWAALNVARRSAVKAQQAAWRQIGALLVNAAPELRDHYRDLPDAKLVAALANTRPAQLAEAGRADTLFALRSLARRHARLGEEITEIEHRMLARATAANPALLAVKGVGPVIGAQLETFGGRPAPSLIAVGSTPKKMVPLASVLGRGNSLGLVTAAVAEVIQSGTPIQIDAGDHHHRIISVPLKAFTGHVHGAFVWVGGIDEQPPRRDLAGAWHFNLTTDTIGGSSDLLDLYGVLPEHRQTERATAEAFERLIPNSDASAALAILVRSHPNDEHQAVWAIRRDDGQLRAGHLSCRAIEETNEAQHEVVLRGITHDVGAADETPAAPPPPVLEQRLVESMAEPGAYRALVNLKNLRILRWIDPPMPGLAWRHRPGAQSPESWIHPADEPAARRLSEELASGHARATLRLARLDGDWLPVDVVANIVLLDQHTTAGLFTLRRASGTAR